MAHVGLKGISKYMKLTSCVNIHGHLHESELFPERKMHISNRAHKTL